MKEFFLATFPVKRFSALKILGHHFLAFGGILKCKALAIIATYHCARWFRDQTGAPHRYYQLPIPQDGNPAREGTRTAAGQFGSS